MRLSDNTPASKVTNQATKDLKEQEPGFVDGADTEAARKYQGVLNAKVPAGAPPIDRWGLTDAERERYQIEPGEEHCWIRDPRRWVNIEFGDRGHEFLREAPGRRIVIHDGHPVQNGDLILAVKSAAEVVEKRAAAVRDAEDLLDGIAEGQLAGVPRAEQQQLNKDYTMQARKESRAHGWIGPTEGMPWQDVMRRKGMEAVEAEMSRHRAAGAHYREAGSPEEVLQRQRETFINQATGRKSFVLGAGLKDGKVVK